MCPRVGVGVMEKRKSVISARNRTPTPLCPVHSLDAIPTEA
jgi:hypothetical protein